MALKRGFTKYQPAKKHKGTNKTGAPEAEENRDVRKRVCNYELVNFNSPGAEILDVSQSLPKEQHDGVIAISIPGVVPSSSAGAMPSRNPPNSPNWTLVPFCSVYDVCLMNY